MNKMDTRNTETRQQTNSMRALALQAIGQEREQRD